MRSWRFFIFVDIDSYDRLLFVAVVRKTRVFEFDVCSCCMLVDFMSSFAVYEVVAGDHRSCYILNTVRITELIDSWLDQTRYSLVMIPTETRER